MLTATPPVPDAPPAASWLSHLFPRLEKLAQAGIRPEDPEELRATKAGLSLLAITGVIASLGLGLYEVFHGFWPGLVLTWGYALLTVLAFWRFSATGSFAPFREGQLAMYLLFPFLSQFLRGGFAASGACMIWALAAPLGAALFHSRRRSLFWFGTYLGLVILFATSEQGLRAQTPRLSDDGSGLLFGTHIGGISLAIFCTVHYFLLRLRQEQARSETLLLNILPGSIARRLKSGQGIIADHFPSASILFADLAGFTAMASTLQPDRVVEVLNRIFTAFDRLSERFGLEKIKTIGDAYLVVGGLPEPKKDHLEHILRMAMAMQEEFTAICQGENLPLGLRIGLHAGPVVAGVIGVRKFSYDLWGDSVNLASRMESTGQAGRIQVTETIRDQLADLFSFDEGRVVEVKGKGQIKAYFCLGPKGPLT